MPDYAVKFTIVDVTADNEDDAVSKAAIEIVNDPHFYLEGVERWE